MPNLNDDLLKKIILIHGGKRIRPYDFKEQGFVLAKPMFKNGLLFFFSHMIIYSISTDRDKILTMEMKNSFYPTGYVLRCPEIATGGEPLNQR